MRREAGHLMARAVVVVVAVLATAVAASCGPTVAPPTGLTASAQTGKVVLDWDDGPAELQGWEVLRSASASGAFSLLTPTPLRASTFHHPGRPGVRSYYRVVAVGQDGTRSTPVTADAAPLGSRFDWVPTASASSGHYEGGTAVVGTKVLTFGGYFNQEVQATTRSEVFDLATGTWSDLPDLPTARSHQAVAVDGPRVWLIGGYEGDHPGPPTAEVLVFDTTTGTYLPGPSLPEPRAAGTAQLVGRDLHFISGATRTAGVKDDADHDDHWVLDLDAVDLGIPTLPLDGETPPVLWEERAPLPTSRNHLGSAVIDGRIWVVGGQEGADEVRGHHRTLEVFDPAAGTWSRAPDLPVGRSHLMWSVVAYQGHLLVAGGVFDGPTTAGIVEAFDPTSGTWVGLANLPLPRKSAVFGVAGDRFFVGLGATSVAQRGAWTGRLTVTW